MKKTIHKFYISSFFIIGIVVSASILYSGLSYYTTSSEERFYHEAHQLLKPSGLYGHGFGIIGSLMMIIGVAVYMIRKRIRRFSRFGILKHWLELHIFLCSVGPALILYHTAFKFGGIVSISFWSMVAVVISGVIGRFIYVLIPRTIEGHEYSLAELEQQNRELSLRLKDSYNIDINVLAKIDEFISQRNKRATSVKEAVGRILSDRFNNKKLLHDISFWIDENEFQKISSILRRKLYVSQRISLLSSLHQIFKYWHIAHLPFALVMLIIMFIHVGVAIAFGYTWIF